MDDRFSVQQNPATYTGPGVSSVSELIPTHKLHKYLQLFAPTEKIDQSVIATLADFGSEFVVSILEEACQIAALKDSKALEPKDVRFVAENLHNIHLPSTLSMFNNGSETMDTLTSSIASNISSGSLLAKDDAHLRRMAYIRQNIISNSISDVTK